MRRRQEELLHDFTSARTAESPQRQKPKRMFFQSLKLFVRNRKPTESLRWNLAKHEESFYGITENGTSSCDSDDAEMAPANLPSPNTPQGFLECLMAGRGYSTQRFSSLASAHFNKASPLQLASYDPKLIDLTVKKRKESQLDDLLGCGISPNACSPHGESLIHHVCKMGLHRFLNILLKHKAVLSICDRHGKTPMHECCWGARPSFQVFKILMAHAPHLIFMTDSQGRCPLQYIPQEHYTFWIDFIERSADEFWPDLGDGEAAPPMPSCVTDPPDSHPIADPLYALQPDLARMVVSGRLNPQEAIFLSVEEDENEDSTGREEDDVSTGTSNYSCVTDDMRSFAMESFRGMESACEDDDIHSEEEEDASEDIVEVDEILNYAKLNIEVMQQPSRLTNL